MFKIVVNPASFEVAMSGNLTGEIWVSVHDEPFPEAGWSDFVSVLLADWIQETRAFLHADSVLSFSYRLMEGPYSVRFTQREGPEFLQVECLRHVDGRVPPFVVERDDVGISVEDLLGWLRVVTEKVASFEKEMGLESWSYHTKALATLYA